MKGGQETTEDSLHGYLDGEKFGSGTGSGLWQHTGGIGLGRIQGGTRFHDGLTPQGGSGFGGVIDEVQVFNDALGASDLQALF